MAKETKALLEKAGYKVVMTRDKDVYISLRGRIERAHKANADLFISIHADSAKNPSAKGLSIYTISETASDSTSSYIQVNPDEEGPSVWIWIVVAAVVVAGAVVAVIVWKKKLIK